MTRVKRGVVAHKKREKRLKLTKGFRWGRKTKERQAKEALVHAFVHAFQGRKEKKRNMRSLWQVKINAAVRMEGLPYSRFIAILKSKGIKLDRKVLAEIAEHEPAAFKALVAKVK